jgi:hypothetical protein
MKSVLPIRLKLEIIQDLEKMILFLHLGRKRELDRCAEDMKRNALFLDEQIQGDVLRFVEIVQFQNAYEPCVTLEIQRAADFLIESMGFVPPSQSA